MAEISRLGWDAGNLGKCQKHGVSIDEIEALFASTPKVGRDENHSEEERYTAIGRKHAGRPMFVIFTMGPSEDDSSFGRSALLHASKGD